MEKQRHVGLRLVVAVAGVALITWIASVVIPVNASTVGFAYLLFILVVASTWGFLEAAAASILATVAFNFFFLPPVGTLTIADPQNWVALFSFLTTTLIASRLSARAKRRELDALERQLDVERLYTFSRAILLIDSSEPFAKQLANKLAETFQFSAVALFDRRANVMFRAGPADFEGTEEQIREAALQGTSFAAPGGKRIITAVRLGSDPIAGLGLQGAMMQDPVLQGIANLVAIGLERARAQDLAHQVEAARQTERLRTTLIDAMAHEFKTPLTSIEATTSLLSEPQPSEANRQELLKVADEEADRLKELIDNAVEMARLDAAQIDIQAEPLELGQLVRDVVASRQIAIDGRPVETIYDRQSRKIPMDKRLVRLAIQQLLDNALKYSPPGSPVTLKVHDGEDTASLEVTNEGAGIPSHEQSSVFQRFYRSPSVLTRIPGSGLGLSIAHRIAQAHGGELTLTSEPNQTTFLLTLPVRRRGQSQ